MKTYAGPVTLILADEFGPIEYEMVADLTLDTDELRRQSLDWTGEISAETRPDRPLFSKLFNTRIRIPGVKRETICYVQEVVLGPDGGFRAKIRDSDPKNPLSKSLSLGSALGILSA